MLRILCALLLVTKSCCAIAQDKLETFSLVALQIGQHNISVQLADTEQKRAQGLMYQTSANPGMLLLYPQPTAISLWMANTAIPLDVAYIGPDWTILQLVMLEPFDRTPVPSPGAVMAALEMPRGWFQQHQISVGQKVLLNPAQ